MNKKFLYLVELFIGLAVLVGASATALGDDFYKGKTIRFIVGYAPGGGYDTYTRQVVRHISKYIPGNPIPVVQNRTGANSLIAANYIYKRAKPDGLTVGIWNGTHVLMQALGQRNIKFKGEKFGWVGAPVKGFPACAIMGHTGLKTWEEIVNSGKTIKMGATGPGASLHDLPKLLNKTQGTKFEVITGYTGTATVRIAMQKQEVDGACWQWESMVVTARSMLDATGDERLIPFMLHGTLDDPEVKDLPQFTQVIKGKNDLAMFKAWVKQYEFQRPLSLPPGTPRERLITLRKAFEATLKDSQFLAEAKKSKLIINYVSGEEIEKHVADILATPASAKEYLARLVGIKKK